MFVLLQVYKEDLPQLQQQSREKKQQVGSLKRQSGPDQGLRLQFVHGYVTMETGCSLTSGLLIWIINPVSAPHHKLRSNIPVFREKNGPVKVQQIKNQINVERFKTSGLELQ